MFENLPRSSLFPLEKNRGVCLNFKKISSNPPDFISLFEFNSKLYSKQILKNHALSSPKINKCLLNKIKKFDKKIILDSFFKVLLHKNFSLEMNILVKSWFTNRHEKYVIFS